jgi:hypothetical protein
MRQNTYCQKKNEAEHIKRTHRRSMQKIQFKRGCEFFPSKKFFKQNTASIYSTKQ